MKYMRVSVLLIVLVAILMTGCTPPATPSPTEVPPAPTEPPPDPTEPPPTPTEEPKALWEEVLRTKVEQPARVAAFLDGTRGLTGGADDAGKTHYTTDGGQTWTMADTSGG
jgi:hypothetical protein